MTIRVPSERSRLKLTEMVDSDSFKGFGDLLAEHTEAITPMSPEELERAIVAPADRAGLSVEPRLSPR